MHQNYKTFDLSLPIFSMGNLPPTLIAGFQKGHVRGHFLFKKRV